MIGLGLGILLGVLLPRWDPDLLAVLLGAGDSAIHLWTNALRLVVTPLVAVQLFVAVSGHRSTQTDAAKLGISIPTVFLGLLVFTGLCAILATSALLATPLAGSLSFSGMDPGTAGPAAAPGAAPVSGGWLDDLVPPSLVAAAARPEAILGLMLFMVAFSVAARRLTGELRRALDTGFQAVRDTFFVLIGWLLWLAPLMLFALGVRAAANSGLEVGGFLAAYLAVDIGVLLICIAALYPLAALGGKVPLGRFARAAFPAQMAAAATRSSLATVPILLRDAELRLGIPPKIGAMVIPLGGATLKLSRLVTSPVKLLFLAHFLQIPLEAGQVAVFGITILLLSPATLGVPSVISGTRSLPAFVAAGIPPEYVILLNATTAIVDVFLTVLNSTGYLVATALVARLVGSSKTPVRQPVTGADSSVPQPRTDG